MYTIWWVNPEPKRQVYLWILQGYLSGVVHNKPQKYTKLVQRVGVIFLSPKVGLAASRYYIIDLGIFKVSGGWLK